MKAVVFHDVGDIRIDDVPEPQILQPTDAIVEITASAICGTDLHYVLGTIPGMKPGTIVGHEAVGIVSEVGSRVHNLRRGDRVVVSPTIACGNCSHCRNGFFAQCERANPCGRRAGPAIFGGPRSSGSFDGLQAEWARVPFAHVGLVKLPDQINDDQAILLADMFPTGYFAAELADISPGKIVAVFGCGAVGQFAILSALSMGASRVIAIDRIPERLEYAQALGAEVINFDEINPVQALLELTGGIGPDRVIDAVGAEARCCKNSADLPLADDEMARIVRQRSQVSPLPWGEPTADRTQSSPVQALVWGLEAIAKGGTLSIVGLYPPRFESFPLGRAFERNLTVRMGICHHRRYIPKLIQWVASGAVDLSQIMPRLESFLSAADSYDLLERHQSRRMQSDPVASN